MSRLGREAQDKPPAPRGQDGLPVDVHSSEGLGVAVGEGTPVTHRQCSKAKRRWPERPALARTVAHGSAEPDGAWRGPANGKPRADAEEMSADKKNNQPTDASAGA